MATLKEIQTLRETKGKEQETLSLINDKNSSFVSYIKESQKVSDYCEKYRSLINDLLFLKKIENENLNKPTSTLLYKLYSVYKEKYKMFNISDIDISNISIIADYINLVDEKRK